MKRALFLVLMALVVKIGIFAEEKTGIVVGRQDGGPHRARILVKVNQESPRPFDHIIELFRVSNTRFPGATLDMMMQNGIIIKFEDSNMETRNGIKFGTEDHLLYVNNHFIFDIFPEWRGHAFYYAQLYEQKNLQH